ncbi:MAG: hypothetical protein R3D58_13605 [Saprospiraceae bacterium]
MRTAYSIVISLQIISFVGAAQAYTTSDCEQAKALIEAGVQEQNLKKRLTLYERAVTLCPEADAPHFFYGLALEEREDAKGNRADYSAAVAEYRKILSINPNHTGALFKLAGIEYVTLHFDSAVVHYNLFLNLEKPDGKNDTLLMAARNLLVKCKWLSRLPENAIKAGALTNDPERFAGLSNLIGRMAFELGRSAMQVTGNIGYGLAGAGVMIGIQALTNKDVNISRVKKFYDAEDYEQTRQTALDLLPKAVNNHGINSEEVFVLLLYLSRCMAKQPEQAAALAPFCQGLIAMQKQFIQLRPVPNSKEQEYNLVIDFTLANEHLGEYQLQQYRVSEAIASFRAARGLLGQYGGRFLNGQRIASENDRHLKVLEFKYDLLIAKAECYADSTYAHALQILSAAFAQLQADPAWSEKSGLWDRYLQVLALWGAFASNHSTVAIDDFILYNDLVSRYPDDKTFRKIAFGLDKSLGILLYSWGEHCSALRNFDSDAELCAPQKAISNASCFQKASMYNTVFLQDSTLVHLKCVALPQFRIGRYRESLILARRLLIMGRTNEGMNLLVECREWEKNNLEIRNAGLLPATTVLWAVLDSQSPEGDQVFKQLQEHWKGISERMPEKFAAWAPSLLRQLSYGPMYPGQKQQLFEHLMTICRQTDACDPSSLDEIRLQYFISTQQWERALEQYNSMPSENPLNRNEHSKDALFQYTKAKSAILYHETGQYTQAAALRRGLLNQLLPFEKELPENVADCKVRLAESLAALGQKQEARKLLEEANATFDQLSPEAWSIRHQRARSALKKLNEGKSDIAFHGALAIEFTR